MAAAGSSPRTVNKHRQLISAVYGFGCREATFALSYNPARAADRRAEPARARLDFYSPDEVEALARALAAGLHRDPNAPAVSADEAVARAREVPLPDQAAGALNRLSRRGDSTSPDDYVFANRLGRRLDGSALRRRVGRARDAAGLRPLRDLHHTYGSQLVAGGIDLAAVKAAIGPSRITTTGRYLHARSAGELADRFTRALGSPSL